VVRRHGAVSLAVLGAVVLCVTGGEALYADMGHFTRTAIRRAWFVVVFPSLLLNYFGQGAAMLEDPTAAENPFYSLVPKFMVLPMVLLATMATVIASQALISGAFSLTRQAIQFDFLPRMRIIHTSESAEGQIYLPVINWTLMVLCIATVLIAGSSTKLAAAYGVAVTADMAITSTLFFLVATRTWGKDVRKTAALVVMFLVFDLGFFFANLLKVFEGGWFPLGTAAALVMVMTTWRQGRFQAARRIAAERVPLEEFLAEIKAKPPHRVPGTAVFMTSSVEGLPFLLQHHFHHVGVLHEQVVLFTVMFDDVPRVRSSRQIKVEDLGQGFKRLTVHCGFMETPYVPDFLRRARSYGLKSDAETTTYFIGRESFVSRRASVMAPWRKQLFATLARNAHSATSYYGIPPGQVVEYGIQVDL
jgi:KUP system potassium uptake protein